MKNLLLALFATAMLTSAFAQTDRMQIDTSRRKNMDTSKDMNHDKKKGTKNDKGNNMDHNDKGNNPIDSIDRNMR